MDLVRFWFEHENLWFGATTDDDAYIAETYGKQMKCAFFNNPKTPEEILRTILFLDQIVWHYDRVHSTKYQKTYQRKAIALSMKALDICTDKDVYTNAQKCFILMPLRHSQDIENQNIALQYIKKFRIHNPSDKYLKRFHRQAICKRSKLIKPILQSSDIGDIDIDKLIKNKTICETSTYDPSMPTNMCYKLDIRLVRNIRTVLGSIKRKIIVSFSCGSDSALVAYLCKRAGYDVYCMMVNYNNRDTMDNEVELARYWTSKMDIPLYVRKIDEITRTRDHDRNLYEEVTKVIRFDSYKHVMVMIDSDENTYVAHGANLDDRGENVNGNIIKGINYHHLLGPKETCIDQGVIIKRPIMILTKKEVVDICNSVNIPYVYDSTPKWSSRGKMRDRLIPCEKEFGLLDGLFALAEHLTDIDSFVLSYVQDQIAKMEVDNCGDINSVRFHGIIVNNFIVIKRLFMELSNKINRIQQPSNKSINNFIMILKDRGEHCLIKATMTSKMTCTYDGTTLSIIFV